MQNSLKVGVCLLCERDTELMFHHLIPKKLHRRTFFEKNYTKEALNQGILICYLCHKGMHKIYDEMTLAKRFPGVKEMKADEALARHFEWAAKQKRSYKK